MKHNPPLLWKFTDFRQWLREYYLLRKQEGRYTFAQMSADFGLGDRAYIQQILAGKRPMPDSLLRDLFVFFDFSQSEQEYAKLMIEFTEAKTSNSKQEIWARMSKSLRSNQPKAILDDKILACWEQWYIFPVRELLCSFGLSDPKELSKRLYPHVSPNEIRNAIRIISDCGLAEINENEQWVTKYQFVEIPSMDWQSALIRQNQAKMLDLAKDSLLTLGPTDRFARSATLSVSEECRLEIQTILDRALQEIFDLVQNDNQPESILQINLNAFPLTLKSEAS